MSYVLSTHQSSILLHCSSRHVTEEGETAGSNEYKTAFDVRLKKAIDAEPGHTMLVSVRAAQIPNAIYTVDFRDNHLQVITGGNTYTYTLEDGNYNVKTLPEMLRSVLGTAKSPDSGSGDITFADITVGGVTYEKGVHYESRTNKLTLAFSSAFSLKFDAIDHPCHKVLGFSRATHVSTGSGPHTVTSDSVVDITGGTHLILLKSDLMVGHVISNKDGAGTQVITKIPVNVPRFGLVTYPPAGAPAPFQSIVEGGHFDFGHFSLGDEDGVEEIDLHGLDWNFTLQFDFVKNLHNAEKEPGPREKMAMALDKVDPKIREEVEAQRLAEQEQVVGLMGGEYEAEGGMLDVVRPETQPSALHQRAQVATEVGLVPYYEAEIQQAAMEQALEEEQARKMERRSKRKKAK